MSDVVDLLKSLGLFGGIGFLIGLVIGMVIIVPFIGPTTRGGEAVLVGIPALVGAVVGGIISALLSPKTKEERERMAGWAARSGVREGRA
jgi:hypothetical protein